VALVVAVLLLQLGFILSYAGAFHSPSPHRMRLGVVVPSAAPAGTAQQLAGKLDALDGDPLRAKLLPDRAHAVDALKHRRLDGALILAPARGPDELLVASAEGGSLSSAMQTVVTTAEQGQRRTLRVHDLVPASTGDARGLTAFYLAVGWVVGGYLVASILAISAGARPASVTRARIRLAALAVYSIASGIGGAAIVGPALGALTGSLWTLSGFGALVVFAVGAFTMAIESLAGIVGIGIAVLLFVVLGNPSAGGAYPAPLLPPFWRAIGPYIPTGAGTYGVRGIVYFGDAGLTRPIVVTAIYAAAGIAVLLLAGRHKSREDDADQDTSSAPA
jgi:hypothetical protein